MSAMGVMSARWISLLRRLSLACAAAAALLVVGGTTEAQFRDGASAQSPRAVPGRRFVRPVIRVRPRRDARLPNRRDIVGPRRAGRSDRQPPRRIGTATTIPPCGTRGTRPCPGGTRPPGRITTTTPTPPCGIRRAGHPFRPCTGRGGNPLVAIPVPGTGDGGPYLRSLGTRQERTPPTRAVTTSPAAARQLLVLLAQNQPAAVENQIASAYRLQRLSGSEIPLLGARAQVYRIDDRRPVQSVIAALAADARVMLVQRNLVYQRQATAGSDAIRAAQYGLDKIGAPRAHQLATGRGVKIAVIDTGIDADHPDLQGAVVETFDATGSSNPRPDMHGTAIAGIIRARGLVLGVAPDATLLAARAFETAPRRGLPESTSFILLRALDWSVRHGANVVNLSFSGDRDPAMERIIAEAVRRNVILVAAAGNGGPKAAPSYPAAYPDVIAVTAHDSADHLYSHANHGAYIAVAAPGVDILVPILKRGHMFMSGTSMSSAYVAGIMALLLERTPNLSPERAKRILMETADDLGAPGRDDEFGAGRVDAPAALETMASGAREIGARQ
jgi:subtilisin family serine protease